MGDGVTIRTLAQLAGVSTATVSLALRNDRRIRPEVRTRIQQIATEAGYIPNPVVANLIAQVRGGRSASGRGTLGAVIASNHPADADSPAIREWTAACESRASQLGYGFDRFVLSQKRRSAEHLANIIDARGIRGLIVIARFPGGVIPPEFDFIWQQTATIVIGDRPLRPALSAVTHDHFVSAILSMREVARLGYRRPGLCLHPGINGLEESRCVGGFAAEQIKLSRQNRIPDFRYQPDAAGSFKRWVKRYRPDVILTLHEEIRAWLASMGLSVPDDIGLVHLDRAAKLIEWAGIQQRHDQIGFAAVDMLTGQMTRNEFGPPPFQKCMFVYGTWVRGETVQEQFPGTDRWRTPKRGRPGLKMRRIRPGA